MIAAHSFGGPVTAVALSRAFEDARAIDVRKIVLLASPNEAADLVRNFGDSLGLNELAQIELEREFEIICGCRLADFTGSKFFGRLGHPLLVVHSEDDAEVSFQHGLAYRSLPNCKFVPLNGVGHRDILYSSKAIRCVTRFLSQ